MVISYNSQLGLRFSDKLVKVCFFKIYEKSIEHFYAKRKSAIEHDLVIVRGLISEMEALSEEEVEEKKEYYSAVLDERIPQSDKLSDIINKVNKELPNFTSDVVLNDEGKYFYICDSVYKAAELIKVNSGFTGRTLKDIDFGKYTYLIGRNEMIRFIVGHGVIKGFYYNDKDNIVFEWGIEIEDGGYFFDTTHDKEFTKIMRVLTFVELGDITIKELEAGRNNGSKKNENKITNTAKNTVYVVDSTWNTIIIRTTGFAVRGHYRLQPYGDNMKDRKLIWISAFEKHGYKRSPKAEIIR